MVIVASVEVEYRSAFEDFSRKAQRVQALTEHPDGDRRAFEAALLELEKAHLAYNDARDAFVRSLLPASAAASPNHRQDHRQDVQAIAELLWEGAGRPTGTAEDDWHRAEAIVQRAVASSCGG
jgi:phosphosulfolactate phosphohydrolase-like enzyme